MITFAGFALGVAIGVASGAFGMVMYLGYKVISRDN